MSTNVKIKIRGVSGWDQVHPETNLDQIADITVAGKSIAKLANPSKVGYVRVGTDGNATIVDTDSVRAAIGAAPVVHSHAQSHITGLVAALGNKADLVGGKIASNQIPDWILGGLKFAAAVNTPTIKIDASFRATHGWTDDKTSSGRYIIITSNLCTVELTANHVFTTGDEGDTTSPVTLEKGDWIVYRGKTGSNYEFDVVNNEYQDASTSAVGIVRLAPGNITTRAGLSASSNPSKVIDEYALRQVMKGIYYEASESAVGSPLQGDLLFEIQ